MPTRAEFEEAKHKRSSLGTFAEKPAEPKARISLANSGAADFDELGQLANKVTAENKAAEAAEAGQVSYAEAQRRAAKAAAERRRRIAEMKRLKREARQKQLRDRAARAHGEPTDDELFRPPWSKERIAAAKEKWLYTVQDNSPEQNLMLAKRLGWPTGRGKDGLFFIATPWGTRIRQAKPKKPKKGRKPAKTKGTGFWKGFTTPTYTVKGSAMSAADELRARVHSAPVTASADDLRARVHGVAAAGQFDEAGVKRQRGQFAYKPAQAKAVLQEDDAPLVSPSGARLVSFENGVAYYSDGSTLDESGWHEKLEGVTATATEAWNAGARKKAAAKGVALPDGSYPIKDKRDWHKARQALGRAKNRAAVVKHLIKRAKALGIPAEEYKGITASTNVGIVAAVRTWDPLLHPRARDGKFIEVGGFIKAIARWGSPTGNNESSQRAEVVAIEPNPKNPRDPIIVVQDEAHGDELGYVEASNVLQAVAPTKAKVGEQMSLADAPLADNPDYTKVRMPEVDDNGIIIPNRDAVRDGDPVTHHGEPGWHVIDQERTAEMGGPDVPLVMIVKDGKRRDVNISSIRRDPNGTVLTPEEIEEVNIGPMVPPVSPEYVESTKEALAPNHKKLGPALALFYGGYADDMVNRKDDFGKAAASRLSDDELEEAITELEERLVDKKTGMSGPTDLRTLLREQSSRVEADPDDIGLDEGMLYSSSDAGIVTVHRADGLTGNYANATGVEEDGGVTITYADGTHARIENAVLGPATTENALGDEFVKRRPDLPGARPGSLADSLMQEQAAEMDYYDGLTESAKAKWDELIAEGETPARIRELFDREDELFSARMAGEFSPRASKEWVADITKVQNALESGGWITEIPDPEAPQGKFTYIDPEAPEDLVRLYTRLMQMGAANGWV